MAVVRNLMVRIGADYSGMRKGMQGATRDLGRFRKDVRRTTTSVRGNRGLAGIASEFRSLGTTVTSSLSQIRGSRGIGGIVSGVRTLTPALGSASKGLQGLASSAGKASRAIGPVGLGLAAIVGILAAATTAIYAASQSAVRFEADLGRLNISLYEGAQGYLEWARAQGLAKQSAVELGATYGNLLGSFITDTKQLQQSTQDLVQATRVISSYTGRNLDDVFNRIRSGMLGSTEAIEDLGVYVNISMIESTKAFREFAGDKSWSQLTFQQQQQIRLAAILEQTYARYGRDLQANVMTKQELLLEQFKDIKLHLSQAFLPIWDSVLPALTRMSEALANVTEQLARFVYMLRGWDYDEMNSGAKGVERNTDAVGELGDSLEETGKQAAKARSELASFDRLNLLGFGSGGGGQSGSGSGAGGSGSGVADGWGSGGSGRSPIEWNFPEIPPELTKRYRIEFDPPRPPDAGMGAVATAVTGTVNSMAAETNARLGEMWNGLQIGTQAGLALQGQLWGEFSNRLSGQLIPGMTSRISADWNAMWDQLRVTTATTAPAISVPWSRMLAGMELDLATHGARITTDWNQLKANIESIRNPLTVAREEWKATLSFMQQQLNAYRPYLEWGLHLIRVSWRELIPDLGEVKNAWSSTLQSMYNDALSKIGGIVGQINSAIDAWRRLQSMLGQRTTAPSPAPSPVPAPVSSPTPSPAPAPATDVTPAPAVSPTGGWRDSLGFVFSREAAAGAVDIIRAEAEKPHNQAAFGAYSAIVPAGRAGKAAAKIGDDVAKGVRRLLENMRGGLGNLVPTFASGGIVSGPTLAMVGEYAGAVNNPEVIAPLSDLESMMGDGEQSELLRQILGAIQQGQNFTVTISEDEVAGAAIRGHNKRARRLGRTELRI